MVAASATLVGVVATMATTGAAAAQPVSTSGAVETERVVVTYKDTTIAARSNPAAVADAADKAVESGQTVRFERRLPTGDAVFSLGGMKPKAEVGKVMAEFRADPNVTAVEPEITMHTTAVDVPPNDTEYAKQWDLFEPRGGMNVPAAWAKSTGRGVNVAVIDTGYVRHSDLQANVEGGYDFIGTAERGRDGDGDDPNPADEGDWEAAGECAPGSQAGDSSWHGTHVAGTIAAVTGNRKGIAGIAPDTKITPVRVLGPCGGSSLSIAVSMLWAAGIPIEGAPTNPNPAEVINMSLGGASAGCPAYYQRTIDRVVARGVTVVVSAGNGNTDASQSTPANCNNVITVGSNNREGGRAWYSNYGSKVEISAPGGETRRATDTPGTITTPQNGILSTLNAGKTRPAAETYKPYQGTSMAAPHISGLVALMKSAKPSLTPAQISDLIKANARPMAVSCPQGCGAGIADTAKTLAAVAGGGSGGGTNPDPSTPTTYTNTTATAIPDNGPAVTSTISVTGRTGSAPANTKVAVDIKHAWRGDVVIDLVAPDGSVYNLKPSSGSDSGDDIKTTYTVNVAGEQANGTWSLRVQDTEDYLAGTLNSWALTI
ncbi:S8 family peptidase [Lentzea pudingi]|nr:S8 family serine peptidase [Lentzea pudingi]